MFETYQFSSAITIAVYSFLRIFSSAGSSFGLIKIEIESCSPKIFNFLLSPKIAHRSRIYRDIHACILGLHATAQLSRNQLRSRLATRSSTRSGHQLDNHHHDVLGHMHHSVQPLHDYRFLPLWLHPMAPLRA